MSFFMAFYAPKYQNKCLCCYRHPLSTFFMPLSSEARKCDFFTRHTDHHSKILQHHRIIIRIAHAHIHTHIRRMRSVCNHHSKILQHHRIIIRIAHAHIHTHTYGVCDLFVIITPRFYNIIASSSLWRTKHSHFRSSEKMV